MSSTMPPRKQKKLRNVPVFKIPLVSGWSLVITSLGDKFYFNSKTNKSQWNAPVSMHGINKELLCALIGHARGFMLKEDILKMVLDDVAKVMVGRELLDEDLLENEPVKEEAVEAKQDVEHIEAEEDGLMAGYASSSEDESEEEAQKLVESVGEPVGAHGQAEYPVEHVNRDYKETPDSPVNPSVEESSDDENGLNLSDLESLDEPLVSPQEIKKRLFAAFTLHKLDPYSMWEFESEKLVRDPAYFLTNQQEMASLYSEWCSLQSTTTENINEYGALAKTIRDFKLDEFTIFKDIRKQNKQLGKMNISKKNQETFFMKLVYYLRLPLDQKQATMLEFIKTKKLHGDSIRSIEANMKDSDLQDPRWYVLSDNEKLKLCV